MKKIMIGSVLQWKPEIRIAAGAIAIRTILAREARVICATSRRLPTSAIAQHTRIQTHTCRPVACDSQFRLSNAGAINGGLLLEGAYPNRATPALLRARMTRITDSSA